MCGGMARSVEGANSMDSNSPSAIPLAGPLGIAQSSVDFPKEYPTCTMEIVSMTTLSKLIYLIRADLYRYGGGCGWRAFARNFFCNPGFQVSFWLRCRSCILVGPRYRRMAFCWTRLVLRRCSIKYGISLSPRMPLGPGLHIGHFGGIVVSDFVSIGRNCNLSHDVTLGVKNRGAHAGYPKVGDNVYIGPGARIIGEVVIGNHAAVGANAVVTHDVPDSAVVVGIPASVISEEGSAGYVNHTDYDTVLHAGL
jgi:serine O-acetyltransferase